jgi:hypothetical protein
MKSCKIPLATTLLAGLLAAVPAHAAPTDDTIKLTTAELKKMGINPKLLVMAHVASDTSISVGSEVETRTQEIAAHRLYKLHIFKLDWTKHRATHESLSLPLKASIQTTLTPDGKTLVCVGNDGSELLAVDLSHKTWRSIFKHENGKPGFHVSPLRMWSDRDGVFTRGFYYDKDIYSQGKCVVKIDPAGSGLSAISKVRDIEPLLAKVPFYGSCIWQSASEAYFSVPRKDKKVDVLAYQGDDSNLAVVGQTSRVDSMAVGQGRLLYGAREADNSGHLYLYDATTRKQQVLGDGHSNYTYLYMSRDGQTILTSVLAAGNRRMTTYYGHEADGYALHPMPAMSDISPGTIRMAPSGEAITFFTNEGLMFRKVPAK